MDVAESVNATAEVQPAATSKRKQTSFAGDVLKLVSGTTVAQAIGVLISPLLTRLYAPEAFGVLALFTSITSIIGVVACLRYELAIMLPEADEEAANVLAVSLLAVVAITALSVPIVTLGKPILLRLLNAPELGQYLWLVPVMVFLGGVFTALNYWNSRNKHFGRLSLVRVVSAASTQAAKLSAGYAGYVSGGTLIVATLFGSLLSTSMLARRIWREDIRLFRCAIRLRGMAAEMVRHRKFPLYGTWSALMNTVSLNVPTLLLSAFFSSTIVGSYALGHRILSMPASLVGGAIAQVFYQRASVAKVDGTLEGVVSRSFNLLISLSIFPFVLLMVIGSDVFALALGSEWSEAGYYAQILAPWMMVIFVSSPLSTLLSVIEKQEVDLSFQIAFLMTRVASLVIGGMARDVRLGLILFSASGAVVATVKLLYTFAALRVPIAPLLRRYLALACLSGVLIVPIAYLKWHVRTAPTTLVLVGVVVISLYYLVSSLVSRDLRYLILGFGGRVLRKSEYSDGVKTP